ncbi:MAG: VanZ family protein, partial [Clostridia bacterium]|nr:VanZ family protein [Clostridia bacterium]
AALVVATVDECIQIFVPGRGPGVLDVLLDTASGIVGMLSLWGVLSLALCIKIKRTENVKKISKTP